MSFTPAAIRLRTDETVEKARQGVGCAANPIDSFDVSNIGDNLRNAVHQPMSNRRGRDFKGINLWQQFQT